MATTSKTSKPKKKETQIPLKTCTRCKRRIKNTFDYFINTKSFGVEEVKMCSECLHAFVNRLMFSELVRPRTLINFARSSTLFDE